jgi:hypothetical protein
MNDRELLELAAKAAGLPECGWMGPAFMYVKDNTFTDWNPLTDDGDALRLAVKLRMDVEPWIHGDSACSRVLCQEVLIDEPHYGDDPERATRRAIVRVAAEIGRAMP